MEVFLHDHVAAAGEGWIFVAYDGGITSGVSSRIFCAIDESDDVAVFEIPEALNLIGNRNYIPDAVHDLGRQFKQRSMRLARMWKRISPGVETAWRPPERIS